MNEKPIEPVQQITVPLGLLAWLLLIPVGRCGPKERMLCRSRQASARGQKPCQKQAVIPDWGRSPRISEPLRSIFNARFFSIPFDGESSREKYSSEFPIRVHGTRTLPSEVSRGLQRKYPRHLQRFAASLPAQKEVF